jgi:hypothetical protein
VVAASTHGKSIQASVEVYFELTSVFIIGTLQLVDDLSQRYPNTCIGDVLRPLTHLDREALMYSLQSLTRLSNTLASHSDLTERLRSQGHTMDILGYTPERDPAARLSSRLVPRNQRWSAFFRVGKSGMRKDGYEPRLAEQLSPVALTTIKSGVTSTHWLPWVTPTEEQVSEIRDLSDSPSPKTWPSFQEDFLRLRHYQSAHGKQLVFSMCCNQIIDYSYVVSN